MNQKGFANITIIVLAAILVGIGAIGIITYLTFSAPQELAKESDNVLPTPTPQKPQEELAKESNLVYSTPRELARGSGVIFEFQYPKGFSVSEGGYTTPGGFRFPSLSIKKDDGKEADVIYIPGGISTGPEITCQTHFSSDDKCVEIQGYVITTKSKDQLVLRAFDIITSTFRVKDYSTYTDEYDPVDNNPADNYGIISGQVIDKKTKQPISGAKIVVKARPVDIAPDGRFSLRSFDSGAVYVGEVITDQRGRYNIIVPLGTINNPLKELNRLNMFIVSAHKSGYSEVTNFMVMVKDGQTYRLDFELDFDLNRG